MGFGYGAIPALGPALDPGRGAWTSASGGAAVTSQSLDVPGLNGPVTVSYTKAGLASINASNDHDLFLALGYVHAKFRLSEMDLERREGEGRLAQLAGPSAVKSDEFELRLGLLRTAQNEWQAIVSSPAQAMARQALLAYSQGVNDDIAQVRASGDWPAIFTLSGAYPAPWTPVDSLVIQGDLTQELDYTTEPLDYAILERSLGATNTANWFPAVQANTWTPYDPGPYVKEPLTPVAAGAASSAPAGDAAFTAAATSASGQHEAVRLADSGAVAQAAGQLLAQVSQLAEGQVHQYPDSNAWAVNGSSVTGGGALLGGDPHLPQTLPSVWYEVALSAPGYQVTGATVPGVPGVLLGHNQHIAWSLTDTQNQATLYYAEKTRGGDEYYWQGQWRPLVIEHYTIPVRGAAAVHLTVDITADGPIMDQEGQQMAVDWMGNVPSDDLTSLLDINQASDFTQFKAALADWRAPTQNFTYADNDPVAGGSGNGSAQTGNIGVYAAGYYPQVPSGCQPWLPMPGDGACDVTGVIPYTAIPQVYDPPSHVVATDNQRPVSASYPYYVGTSDDFYDPGYRAGHAYSSLESSIASGPVSAATIAALQDNLTDSLAQQIVPQLLAALKTASLTPMEKSAASLLTSWNDSMDENSAAATVWWQFWSEYVSVVFGPWWKSGHVPVQEDRPGLIDGVGLVPLDEDLQAWTLAAGTASSSVPPSQAAMIATADAAFRGPSGNGPGDATAAMAAAFSAAVSRLARQLGDTPSTWAWGRIHSREFPSLAGAAGLGYGPRAAGGDPFTDDAADGGLTATAGPSWRMVATLSPGTAGSGGTVTAEGVYPGGQSENPASPWYSNLISLWWNGQYLPVPAPGSVAGPASGGVTWSLHG
jgi:penicillin G amidase